MSLGLLTPSEVAVCLRARPDEEVKMLLKRVEGRKAEVKKVRRGERVRGGVGVPSTRVQSAIFF